MEKRDVEELRDRVLCAAVLERAGFAIDLKESTRRAVKYRRGDDIIIVIHDGKGWFDPLSDAKGDVFSLVAHLDGIGFAEVLQRVSELVGFVPSEPVWTRQPRDHAPDIGVTERWRFRRAPWRGSMTGRYLRNERDLPESVIRAAMRQDRLREDRAAVYGPLMSTTTVSSPAGKNADRNGADSPPAAGRYCSAWGHARPFASALRRRRSTR